MDERKKTLSLIEQTRKDNKRYQIYTAVGMMTMMMFFWVLEPCRLVGRCQHFGETYCLHLQCAKPEEHHHQEKAMFGILNLNNKRMLTFATIILKQLAIPSIAQTTE
jgi:hypothetical protein